MTRGKTCFQGEKNEQKRVFLFRTFTVLCPVAIRLGGKIFRQVLLESDVRNNQKSTFSCGHVYGPVSSIFCPEKGKG